MPQRPNEFSQGLMFTWLGCSKLCLRKFDACQLCCVETPVRPVDFIK